jgi:hypothetical protein
MLREMSDEIAAIRLVAVWPAFEVGVAGLVDYINKNPTETQQ